MKHELKTWPEYFEAVASGEKTFEIRKNDREFKVEDVLLLKEFDPNAGSYSGRAIEARVIYMTDYQQKPGYVVMSIKVLL
jgi:ASC-1-like (ASCH) protein